MKRNLFIVLLSIMTFNQGYSQTDSVIGYIEYIYKVDTDTSSTGENLQYTKFKLWFGKVSAFSGSESLSSPAQMFSGKKTKSVEDSLRQIKMMESVAAAMKESAKRKRYRHASNNVFVSTEQTIAQNSYCIYDTIPRISWKLKEDTMTILGIKCQMAEGYFLGRKYNVWYTPEIPLPFGPGNLGNLPGLIIEAYDERKERIYSIAKLEIPAKKENIMIIEPSCSGTKAIGRNEFNKINNEERIEMMRRSKAASNNPN
ncbi:GLPGLI family protein [Lacibacter sp. MH-610]|uniref:GLPGLI family protein n=1 Tax=Lacibacter sp. MH-610 TaxID=3020883 RepID=UPI0038929B63